MATHVAPEAYKRCVNCLKQGGVVAYPTESVYGLGCDPFDEAAVKKLLALKQRSVDKGLIIIGATVDDVKSLIGHISNEKMQKVLATWPGPINWLFPKSHTVPAWLHGQHDTIALRVVAHPQAKQLCEAFSGPLVSTSANLSGQPPAKNNIEVYEQFGEAIDYILPGRVGGQDNPCEIRDAISGTVIRPA